MSYQALYRKYRPMTFDEVVGQEVATKTLKNALKTGKISHAYLFSGPRGTGKTSIAKIFAKAINCENSKSGNPCLSCEKCLIASSRECSDIIEIDAASNNGVDEIRELRNKVTLVPSELKYKVYIIDEVHMLSIGAFNALLKTLEEPPGHVIFILATTDLHKVPITIISRCQCFSFKRINENSIITKLSEIAKLENISIDADVLKEIAKYSDGGMRDAVGMLDKLISYSTENITLNDMREINGLISDSEIEEFINFIQNKDILAVLNKIEYLYNNGKDMIRFVEELILNLRNQLVHKYLDNINDIDDEFINNLAITLNGLLTDLQNSNNIRVLIEIRLLKYMNENSTNKQMFDTSSRQPTDLDLSISGDESTKSLIVEDKEEPTQNQNKIGQTKLGEEFRKRERLRINNTFALASKKDLIDIRSKWNTLIDYTLDREIGAVACFLTDGTPVAVSSKNLILTFEYPSMIDRGNDMIEKIETTLQKIIGHQYRVVLLTEENWNIEKQKFIDNKNQNIEYHYQEEVLEEKREENHVIEEVSDITKTAIQLFGENVVKIDN